MTVKLSYRVVRITHRGGYWERVCEILQEGATNYEAWDKIETELLEYGFPARHTNFSAFKTAKGSLRHILSEWKAQKHFLQGYLQ